MNREREIPMAKKRTSIALMTGLSVAAVLAAMPDGSPAQETATGWQPYLGCWEPQGTELDEGVLCFVADGGSVEMLTVLNGAVAYREPFLADGTPRRVEQEGCEGTESAQFSNDMQRLYTVSDVACDGQPSRRSTGIISMPEPGHWLDVRAMEADGGTTAWSRWYQRAEPGVLRELGITTGAESIPFSARGAVAYATAPITIEDVIDASRHVSDRAVQAWIVETGQEFRNLAADDLIRLEDAGVGAEVIDVVVAVSFPEQFALGRDNVRESMDADRRRGVRSVWLRPFGGYYNDPFYYGYSPRLGYGYGWYGYGGYNGWWSGVYRPVTVGVTRVGPSDSGGRVVAGRGYTRRGGQASTDPSSGTARSYPRAPKGSGRSAVGTQSGGSRATVGSTGSKSRGSASRGSTGRKAKKRGGR